MKKFEAPSLPLLLVAIAILLPVAGCDSIVKEDEDTYKVTYDGNGSTGGAVPVDTKDYEKGDTVTVAGYGTLVKTGSGFKGWNTKADGSGTQYVIGSTFTMPGASQTLFAIWTTSVGGSWVFKAATTADRYQYASGMYADTIVMDMTESTMEMRFYLDTEQVHGSKTAYTNLTPGIVTQTPTHTWNPTAKKWETETGSPYDIPYSLQTYTITVTMPEYTGNRNVVFGRAFFTKPSNLVGTWKYSSGADIRTLVLNSNGTFTYSGTEGASTRNETGIWDASTALGIFRSVVYTDDLESATDWDYGWENPYVLNSTGTVMTQTEQGAVTVSYTKQ